MRNQNGQTEEEFLKDYNPNQYESPSVTADMIIFTVSEKEEENYRRLPEKELKVLLVKRKDHPYIGRWALPGGFININESLDEGAYRELQEETNISNIYMEQLYTWGDVERDPRKRIISTSYLSLIDSSSVDLKAGSDAADVKWFTLKKNLLQEHKQIMEDGYVLERIYQLTFIHEEIELSTIVSVKKTLAGKITRFEREIRESNDLAFDHAKIIDYAWERLQKKIEYTDIAFNLLPEFFTLTEIQQVYEVILGKELFKANFRRKIEPMVIETNETTKDTGHRPSKLYKFNPHHHDDEI